MTPPESEYERCTLMNNAYAKLNQFMQSLMQSCLKKHYFFTLMQSSTLHICPKSTIYAKLAELSCA